MTSRLKSLELHGYKTFANRTVFEYPGSITAIVGPNGSGKSNIADSIRWVLGEQSYTLLRGKKTEDMIFSGSDQRPRAGMASATMVFDNQDGWLPIDFSEVAVTRRAYRDGQNEYLINGSRVRLRDVSELLSNSGLAERTYTVIGQGLVDAALALKAEERRRLFEEAAGIGLYRARREEAMRRLDTTRRNLERAQDILAELVPRLRSLEKQARRAQEYEQLRIELRSLLREWYGYHWHQAQLELTVARKITFAREETLNQARDQQTILEEQLKDVRQRIQDLRSSLGTWHRELSSFHARREELSREQVATDERLRSLQEQEHLSQIEISRLEEEIALHQETVSLSGREVEDLTNELEESRKQFDIARQALEKRQAERHEVETALQSVNQTLNTLLSKKAELLARQEGGEVQIDRLSTSLESLSQNSVVLEEEANQAQAALFKADDSFHKAEQKFLASQEAINEHRQRLGQAEGFHQKALAKRMERLSELARLQAQRDVIEQAEASLAGYAEGAKVLLEAARADQLTGVRGSLSHVIDVPAEYETAVAAALGEYTDAIILDKQVTVEEALDLLVKNSSRGILLPIDSLKPTIISQQPDISGGIIGVASQLVSVTPELRPVVDLLLAQVVIVKDRKTGQKLVRKVGKGVRVVTLEGVIFHESGQVLTGNEGQTSIIGRKRQQREVQKSIEKAEKEVGSAEAKVEQAEVKIENLHSEEKRLAKDFEEARLAMEMARDAHSQADLTVERIENRRRLLQEQISQIDSEMNRIKGEATQYSTGLASLDQEILAVQVELRSQESNLNELTLDEFQFQLNHWNARVQVLEQAAIDATRRHSERETILQRTLKLSVVSRTRKDEMKGIAKELEENKIEQRQAEIDIGRQIEDLNKQIKPAEADLEKAEKELIGFQEKEIASRQKVSALEQHFTQSRISQARQQERLDALRRRIEDDFGLVAFEYSEDISGQAPLPLDGMVERLPRVTSISPELEENINQYRLQLRRMGAINPEAQVEFDEVSERHRFMDEQINDLEKAEADIHQVIRELDDIMQQEFRKTFDAVAEEFKSIFVKLFGGGSARLVLTDPDDLTGTGIDIEARLPGKRTQGLSLLSGGERSLTATALVFALLRVSPTPFCVLDEVDAMLDEANVGRFSDLLQELSQKTQFVIVTHNRNTVQVANLIYGVSMGRDSTSQVISLRLDQVDEVLGK